MNHQDEADRVLEDKSLLFFFRLSQLMLSNDFLWLSYTSTKKELAAVQACQQFFYPNQDDSVTETGYLADNAGPAVPNRKYFMLGSLLTGGSIVH